MIFRQLILQGPRVLVDPRGVDLGHTVVGGALGLGSACRTHRSLVLDRDLLVPHRALSHPLLNKEPAPHTCKKKS